MMKLTPRQKSAQVVDLSSVVIVMLDDRLECVCRYEPPQHMHGTIKQDGKGDITCSVS